MAKNIDVVSTAQTINAEAVTALQDELALYDMNISLDPADANSYYMKAKALTKLWKLINKDASSAREYVETANNCYNKAIELAPDNSLYLLERARFYLYKDEIALAISDIEQAKKLPKNNDTSDIYVGNTISELMQEIEEHTSFEFRQQHALTDTTTTARQAAMNSFPTSLSSLSSSSEVLDLKREITRCNQRIKEGLEDADNYYCKAKAQIKLGSLIHDLKMYDNATRAFTKAIELSPDNALFLVDRGRLYMELGRDDLAQADFNQVKSSQASGKIKDILVNQHVQGVLPALLAERVSSQEYEHQIELSRETLLQTIEQERLAKEEERKLKEIEIAKREKLESDISLRDRIIKGYEERIKVLEEKIQEQISLSQAQEMSLEIIKEDKDKKVDTSSSNDTSVVSTNSASTTTAGHQDKSNNTNCLISCVELEYDNELFNHYNLFKRAIIYFGLDKSISLSNELSSSLLQEAIINDDSELVLAGMLSLVE